MARTSMVRRSMKRSLSVIFVLSGCGCIFSLIRKLIVLTAVSAFLYVATFTGYTYHVKQRVPTVDEFKAFTLESYHLGSERALEYYAIVDKHSKVYYAHFEKEYLPTIQVYTKVSSPPSPSNVPQRGLC